MATDKFLCGSTYFFQNFEDFKGKDIDEIILVDEGNGYNYVKHVTTGNLCKFYIVRRPKAELISYVLDNEKVPGMVINRFLIPEFAAEFGITITDLKKLKPLLEKLDDKHKYLETIYNAYITNKTFELTEEQLNEAYQVYKEARKGSEDNETAEYRHMMEAQQSVEAKPE